ncbi:MAG: hypothetical protein ACYTGH_09360, partial [Planctomycetota bacterium]
MSDTGLKRQKFVTRGTFVAMPLCFPSVSEPLPPEERPIQHLHVGGRGLVYGATRGPAGTHLFAASPQPPGGYVHFFAHTDSSREIVGLQEAMRPRLESEWPPEMPIPRRLEKWGRIRILLAAWNRAEGALVESHTASYVIEGIQEWGFNEYPAKTLLELPGEVLLDLQAEVETLSLLCLSESRLIRCGMAEGEPEVLMSFERPPLLNSFLRFGLQGLGVVKADGSLSVVPQAGTSEGEGVALPVDVSPSARSFATDAGTLLVEPDGAFSHVALPQGDLLSCGTLPLAPVGAVGVHPGNRAYAFCGEGIGRFVEVDLA